MKKLSPLSNHQLHSIAERSPRRLSNRPGIFSLLLAMGFSGLLGCGASTQTVTGAPHRVTHTAAKNDSPPSPQTSEARVIAQPLSATIGPYLAFRTDRALAVYASEDHGNKTWFSRPLDASGRPSSKAPVPLSKLSSEPTFAVLRPSNRGFSLLWSSTSRGQAELFVQGLDADGKPLDPPGSVVRSAHRIVWADYHGTSERGIVVWSEEQDSSATVYAREVDNHLQPSGDPSPIVENAKAWDIAPANDGLVIASVVAHGRRSHRGAVHLYWLDAHGHTSGEPTTIWQNRTANADVRVVRSSSGWVVAWTNHAHGNDTVLVSSITDDRKIQQRGKSPFPWVGNQRLDALVSSSGRETIIAAQVIPSSGQCRRVTLAKLDGNLSVSTVRANVPEIQTQAPELIAHGDELIALTSGKCGVSKDMGPLVSRFEPSLRVDSSGPLAKQAAKAMAWDPGCTSERCFTLLALPGTPTKIQTQPLTPVTTLPAQDSPVTIEDLSQPLQVRATGVVYTHFEPLAALEGLQLADRTALVWLSRFEGRPSRHRKPPKGAPGNPRKPMEAQLGVVFVGPDGRRIGKRSWISVRARTAGGMSVAPNLTNDKELCVAWTARDGRFDQVFLTRVSSTGKRKLQRMLTRGPHSTRAVSLAPTAGGWLVSWIQTQRVKGKKTDSLMIARVSESLIRVGPVSKLLTTAAGQLLDLVVTKQEDKIWVGYATKNRSGGSRIFVVRVEKAKLGPVGDPVLIADAKGTTSSLRASRTSSGVALGWTNTGNGRNGDESSHVALFDPSTGSVLNNEQVPGPWSRGSMSLQCERSVCRGLTDIAVSPRETALRAFVWNTSSGQGQGRDLLSTGDNHEASPVIVGERVYFLGISGDGQPQVRWARTRWTK